MLKFQKGLKCSNKWRIKSTTSSSELWICCGRIDYKKNENMNCNAFFEIFFFYCYLDFPRKRGGCVWWAGRKVLSGNTVIEIKMRCKGKPSSAMLADYCSKLARNASLCSIWYHANQCSFEKTIFSCFVSFVIVIVDMKRNLWK